MADADFTEILIHSCTIQRRDAAAVDEYGHTKGDYAESSTGVDCRLEAHDDSGRFVERMNDAKSLVGDYLLMVEATADIIQGDRITAVLYSEDSSVFNAGPFSVLRVVAGDDGTEIHHKEAELDLVSASDR